MPARPNFLSAAVNYNGAAVKDSCIYERQLIPTTIVTMQRIVALILIFNLTQGLRSEPVVNQTAPASASNLVDAWLTSQKLRQSFMLNYEITTEEDGLYHHPNYAHLSGGFTQHTQGELRYDGSRIFYSRSEWTESKNTTLAISQDKPKRRSWLWDGRVHYFYTPGVSVRVTVCNDDLGVHREAPTALFMGYMSALHEPLDVILRRSGAAKVRPATEVIDGFPCSVIESSGPEGHQTVWIDTQRDNNLVKAEVKIIAGEMFNGKPLADGYQMDASLSKVQLKQINGVWFPTNYHYDASQIFPDGHIRSRVQGNFSQVKVTPDLDTIRAFVPTMIENGTLVRLKRNRFVWRDGAIVDDAGNKVPL